MHEHSVSPMVSYDCVKEKTQYCNISICNMGKRHGTDDYAQEVILHDS